MYSPLIIAILLLPVTFAQFGNFFQQGFNPFNNGQQQQQQQQQQDHRGQKRWTEMDAVHCGAGYVCPGSLACMPTPADCPCPYPEDIKCIIPDSRARDEGEGPPFVCARKNGDCEEVVRFSHGI